MENKKNPHARNEHLGVRLTLSEKWQLKRAARKKNKNVSEFVRDIIKNEI